MYDLGQWFPQHYLLRDNWRVIAKEIINIRKNYILPKLYEINQTFDRISDEKWSVFVIKWYDRPSERNCKLAPETCKILEQLPEIRACMFSILEPGTYIPPHKGPFKGSLRYHLGLQIPKSGECYIEVDGVKYYWKEGEDILFDDTYKHSVYNNSSETRIVLFCDVERPMIGPMRILNKFLNDNASVNTWIKAINQNGEKVLPIEDN
jgi:beta-hydroxylase